MSDPSIAQQTDELVRNLTQKAHLEARQRVDIRRDLAQRIRSSDGPFKPGQSVWYWDRDMSKLRGGEWKKARVNSETKPPMVTIDLGGQVVTVNQSKLRKNPDSWHDVVIPGIDDTEVIIEVPGTNGESSQQVPEAPATPTYSPASPAPMTPPAEYGRNSSSSHSISVTTEEVTAPTLWVTSEKPILMEVSWDNDMLSAFSSRQCPVAEPHHIDRD